MGHGHCALNLDLDGEHACEHARGVGLDISDAGKESRQTCIQICSEFFSIHLIFRISLVRVLKYFPLTSPH